MNHIGYLLAIHYLLDSQTDVRVLVHMEVVEGRLDFSEDYCEHVAIK